MMCLIKTTGSDKKICHFGNNNRPGCLSYLMITIQLLIKGSDSQWSPGEKKRLGGTEWNCSCCRQGSFPSHCWRSSSDPTGRLTISFKFEHLNVSQADPEGRFTTFIKALQATRLDKEITDYNSKCCWLWWSYYDLLLFVFIAGPWTVFAPTNTAFMNLPMKELEELITNPKKLSKLVLNHIINR